MKCGNEACCESGLSGRPRAMAGDVAGSVGGGGGGGVVSREEGFVVVAAEKEKIPMAR